MRSTRKLYLCPLSTRMPGPRNLSIPNIIAYVVSRIRHNVNRRDLLMLVFLSTPVALDPPEDMSPGPPGAPPPYKSCWSRMLRLMESGSFDLDVFCQICVIRE